LRRRIGVREWSVSSRIFLGGGSRLQKRFNAIGGPEASGEGTGIEVKRPARHPLGH